MVELKLSNRSHELAGLLSASLCRVRNERSHYGRFSYWDDLDSLTPAERHYLEDYYFCDDLPFDYDDDEMDIIWPHNINSRSGKGHRSRHRFNRKNGVMVASSASRSSNRHVDGGKKKGGKKTNRSSSTTNIVPLKIENDLSGDDTYLDNKVKVYYYPDYHNDDDRVEFSSLIEFDEFCRDEGFQMDNDTLWQLFDGGVSHCCLDPVRRANGELCIICESSYDRLFYEVCQSDELSFT